MSFHAKSHQHPDIGSVAIRLLTIPVMSIALVAAYIGLKVSALSPPDAGVAPGQVASAAPAATAGDDDAAILAHKARDPAGAGRYVAP